MTDHIPRNKRCKRIRNFIGNAVEACHVLYFSTGQTGTGFDYGLLGLVEPAGYARICYYPGISSAIPADVASYFINQLLAS
jgi:hypothetical protein